MRPRRSLVLRRESLAQLGSTELTGVAGGSHVRTDCDCVTHGYTCDACDLPSLPLNTCGCHTFEYWNCS